MEAALNSVACLAAFAALGCMLQSTFRASGKAFRWSVKALAAALLVSAAAPFLFRNHDLALPEILTNVSLAVVLCLMRLRQTQPAWYDCLEARLRRLVDQVRARFRAPADRELGYAWFPALLALVFVIACWVLIPRNAGAGVDDPPFRIKEVAVDRAAGTVTITIKDYFTIIDMNNDKAAQIRRLQKLCKGVRL